MQRISASDSTRISELVSRLGDRTLRQLLTPESKRLVRPERLQNLRAGTGRLSQADRERLRLVSANANQLVALKAHGKGKAEWRVNRAMSNWITNGKPKGVDYNSQDAETKSNQLRAIKALRYLGVDPQDGKFYVRRV